MRDVIRRWKPPEGWLQMGDTLHCQRCGRVPRVHSWHCKSCRALLCAHGLGTPHVLCHDEAELVCPPEHPWDLVHVLVFGASDEVLWHRALEKVAPGTQSSRWLC